MTPKKVIPCNRGNKIRLMSWKFYADLLSPALTISGCFISGKSDLYHCLLSNAGAPPQLVKTACLNLHTSDRITALGVLVCWQQFILMCCHNMEFFNALHHGASKSHYAFSTARCYRFSKERGQSFCLIFKTPLLNLLVLKWQVQMSAKQKQAFQGSP